MSKMSNIAMQLDEKAVELGFADHLEALGNGYEWGVGQDGEAFLFKPEDEQEKAHEAWLEEKENLLYLLKEFAVQFEGTLVHRHKEFFDLYRRLEKFIKEAHD